MAKAYAKNVDFVLSDKFWKEYKPAAVTDTGLGAALRTFEKAQAAAEKLSTNEKDVRFKPNDAAKAWAQVCKALGDVAQAMPGVLKAIDAASKKAGVKPADKTGMENLHDAIEKAEKQLKSSTHPSYVSAFGRQQKYTKIAMEHADLESGPTGYGELGFQEFLKRQKVAEVRAWKNDARKLVQLAPKDLLTGDFANEVRGLSTWDRKGTLKITSAKTFASEVKRSVQAREKAMNVFADARKKAQQDHPDNKELIDLLGTMTEAMFVDKDWWEDLGDNGAKEIDKLRKAGWKL